MGTGAWRMRIVVVAGEVGGLERVQWRVVVVDDRRFAEAPLCQCQSQSQYQCR
jgi:hypothetical protein